MKLTPSAQVAYPRKPQSFYYLLHCIFDLTRSCTALPPPNLHFRGEKMRVGDLRLPLSSTLLLFAAVPGCSALVMSHRHSRPRSATQRAHEARACADAASRDNEDNLERRFASELARRQAGGMKPVTGGELETGSDEPFRGVREVVLDSDGTPKAIPKRAPPPPADTLEDNAASVRSLFSTPEFLLGTVISLGSVILLLAIANADAAA